MKLGILREGKTPADNRVPLTPEQCVEVQKKFPGVRVLVQTSDVRCFSDEEYREKGIPVQEDVSDCDVLMGVKEVIVDDLIPGKIYFFFSHTIKKQEYNRKLLQTILQKKIQLVDYEVLTDENNMRIIGFGRFAGLVGTYNGLRALGLRMKQFDLKPAHQCDGLEEMLYQLERIQLPPVKIAFTGNGRVAGGVLEVLEFMKIRQLQPNEYLAAQQLNEPVYCQLLPQHYVKRKDGNPFDLKHFFEHPEMYDNAFLPFAASTDLLIAAAYWDPKAPVLFTAADAKNDEFSIEVISDITCDIEGSIPTTKRASTVADPFYDYNPHTGAMERPFSSDEHITVQAVDNLPNELPKDASLDFGRNLIGKVFPALFGDDSEGIIKRASVTKGGKLTQQFSYLQDFVSGQ
ncbi:Alanine dehydrogenase [Mariniphaga anaerophila]|uniref:Saccharopine dehydrogenase [NAD(+), L-lysine-forming] n=1 Tax=Mariniphaga anaerophila TaxID=1484053 RepID=A0A1M5EWL8_9BACT|nr:NAD(P)-dependent oxidoreductase [Mariniphaga anaerophila]SHF83643.1 Alanine dehydrogenase [Mariniphaga anaerophila]